MTRKRAAATHLLVSTCIGATVAALILFLWYPDFYFKASGAQVLMATLIFVDVVLGPALTLLLFKPGKRGLAFDMAVIFILQISALIYGLSVIIGSRPVFLVAAVDRFVVISANQLNTNEMPADPDSPYRQRSLTGAVLVGLKLPTDVDERNRLTILDVSGQPSEAMPKLYVPYAEVASVLIARARPLQALLRKPDAAVVQTWLSQSGRKPDELIWVPMQARKLEMAMVMEKDSGLPITALPVDPW